MTWMIYGAYGYTGRLTASLAAERGEMPLLAGRHEGPLRALAELLQLEHRVVRLDDRNDLARALQGVDAVAHCAGPFAATARPMVDACLRTGTHYLDITGEVEVIEETLGRHGQARTAGVTLLPAAGFDVVPSDGLASLLAGELPGARHLALAIRLDGSVSPGTASTALAALGKPAVARIDGVLGPVPARLRQRKVAFPDGETQVTALPLADLATAPRSTGIGNVVTYAPLPSAARPLYALSTAAGPLMRNPVTQWMARSLARRLPGPSARTRTETRAVVWGEVADDAGRTVQGTVSTPNGYDFTADAVIRIAAVLEKGALPPGAFTPAQALGSDFLHQLDGVKIRVPL
jgi:short subunit dehydrogenase-like uncharacterized protein